MGLTSKRGLRNFVGSRIIIMAAWIPVIEEKTGYPVNIYLELEFGSHVAAEQTVTGRIQILKKKSDI